MRCVPYPHPHPHPHPPLLPLLSSATTPPLTLLCYHPSPSPSSAITPAYRPCYYPFVTACPIAPPYHPWPTANPLHTSHMVTRGMYAWAGGPGGRTARLPPLRTRRQPLPPHEQRDACLFAPGRARSGGAAARGRWAAWPRAVGRRGRRTFHLADSARAHALRARGLGGRE